MTEPLLLQPQTFEPVNPRRPKHGYTETDAAWAIARYIARQPNVVSVKRVLTGQFRTFSGHIARGAREGTLDWIVTLNGGQCAWIDIKKPGCYPSGVQRDEILRIRAHGGVADIVRNFKDVRLILSGGRVWSPRGE